MTLLRAAPSTATVTPLARLLLCSLALAAAVEAGPQGDLCLLESPHFDIYYSPPEREAARQVAVLAERSYAELSRLFGRGLDRRHTLRLYPTPSRYRAGAVGGGMLSAGSGGVTQGERAAIAMPIGASLADTAHVVAHELVHAFQYEAGARSSPPFPSLAPWFIEGRAEYLSLGPRDPGVLTWVRDAARQARAPALSDLSDPGRLPYLGGHGVWRFLVAHHGTDVARQLLAAPGDGLEPRLRATTGLTLRELSERWERSLRDEFGGGRGGRETGRVVAREGVAPSLSPDGRLIAWASPGEPARMWLADSFSGAVRHELLDPASSPRYDSLHALDSSAAWDPAGRRLAFAASRAGRALLVIVNAASGRLEREVSLSEPGEVSAPAWSPDGNRLAFSGQSGGRTDLYVYDLRDGTLRRLTDDAYADLQPAWSPGGDSLVFASDRFTTDLAALRPGALRLAIVTLETASVSELPGTPGGRNINPRFGRNGDELLFVGDPNDSPGVYRLSLSRREIARITVPGTEVAGLTASSPALSATRGGALACSIFRDGRYQVLLTRLPATLPPTQPAAFAGRDARAR